jgi:hypothetical protein
MVDDSRYSGSEKYCDIITLYRAVGTAEYYSIMDTNKFETCIGMTEVKYFALNLKEIIVYADKSYITDVVAIFEIVVKRTTIERIGDFTHVDPSIFKSGTVIIHEADIDEFNQAIISIYLRV